MKSFTAFGLSAQFRKRIDEADELLSQLRDQAILNGRIQVGTIASANRFTTGGYGQKMQQVELVIASLRKFGVPPDEIDDICKPYVRNITYDAARAYFREMSEVAHQAISDLGVPMNQARHDNDNAGLAALELRVTALEAAVGENLRDLDGDQILAFMENEREALEGRDERDFSRETKLRLEALRQEAVRVIQDTRARGNITREGNWPAPIRWPGSNLMHRGLGGHG